jgi:acyl-CoA reductase-like NAD-dependent aldehyde dehydrogenase
MPEEQQPESNRPAPPKGLVPRRRGRRGGRGRRRPAPAVPISGQSTPAESSSKQTEPPIRLREQMPVRPTPSSKQKFQPAASAPIEPPKEKFRPAPRAAKPEGSAISRAVNEVTDIVESLREALTQMEEVLELVEHAERQKITDEREIESLLRALHQLQSRGGRTERPERPQSDD